MARVNKRSSTPTAANAPHGDHEAVANSAPANQGKRRGRPPGSVSLKPETTDMVVGLIRKGVPVLRAVRMAGLSRRTHHEYMARGEGRHERGSTPVLKDYAERVGRAIEESIGLAEAKLFESGHIRYWLQRRDSEQGEDGQGGLIERAALSVIGEEELVAECFRMLRFLLEDGTINVPPCSDAHCRCRWHEAKEPPGARPVGTGKTSTRANGRRAR